MVGSAYIPYADCDDDLPGLHLGQNPGQKISKAKNVLVLRQDETNFGLELPYSAD